MHSAGIQHDNKKHPRGVLFFNCLSFRQKNNVCVAPCSPAALNDKTPDRFGSGVRLRAAATYSPTWSGSTIGTNAFNFSVRNGKRWVHVVIATMILLHYRRSCCVFLLSQNGHIPLYAHILRQAQPCLKACCAAISIPDWSDRTFIRRSSPVLRNLCKKRDNVGVFFSEKVFGILVLLGYDVTAFTPAAYLRSRLLRPSMEISS